MNRCFPSSNRMAKRQERQGFTLIELLLVLAILVILTSIGSAAYLTYMRNARVDAAALKISELEMACTSFKLNVGYFPDTLDDLYAQPANITQRKWRGPYLQDPVPMDPWGNPYAYTPDNAQERVFITSSGPDGQQGTADDVPDPAEQNG